MSKPDPQPSADGAAPRRRHLTQQTTERLLEAAATEFIERGYEAARVSSIARRAGLTPGAVYARWPAKSDVMVAALDYILQQILPARRLKDSGVDSMGPRDMIAILGASLMARDELRDVMVQAFGSARNNDEIRACLQSYLNRESQQISRIIDEAKDAGVADPDLSTSAMSLLCQAAGIGVHLLISAGLEDQHVPTEDEWNSLVSRLITATAPPGAATA